MVSTYARYSFFCNLFCYTSLFQVFFLRVLLLICLFLLWRQSPDTLTQSYPFLSLFKPLTFLKYIVGNRLSCLCISLKQPCALTSEYPTVEILST